MKTFSLKLVSICVFFVVIFIPYSQAIENKLIQEEYDELFTSFFYGNNKLFSSFLKKIWGFVEIFFGISLSIAITHLLSLRLLPIILEIGFGPLVYFLSMIMLLTIPVQFLNGICLLVQKQFSLGKIQTGLLTIISFVFYIFGTLIFNFLFFY